MDRFSFSQFFTLSVFNMNTSCYSISDSEQPFGLGVTSNSGNQYIRIQPPECKIIRRKHVTMGSSQQTQNIFITFVQRRPNVFDVGPTLYNCDTNVLCSQGWCFTLRQGFQTLDGRPLCQHGARVDNVEPPASRKGANPGG